jgi:hypothetical protein
MSNTTNATEMNGMSVKLGTVGSATCVAIFGLLLLSHGLDMRGSGGQATGFVNFIKSSPWWMFAGLVMGFMFPVHLVIKVLFPRGR